MATFYSSHFSPTQPGLTLDTAYRPVVDEGHARLRVKRIDATLPLSPAFTANDIMRLATFRSSDRIYNIFVTSGGASGTVTVDLGLYLSGGAHDGAVLDADVFSSALAVNGVVARVDQFTESGVLANLDRGKPLWQLGSVISALYSSDPRTSFDLCLTATATLDTAAEPLLIEVWYVAGD
jgi:hypothetical protein